MAFYFFSENPCIFLAALSSSRSLVVSLLVSDIFENLPSYVTALVTFVTVVTVGTVVKEVTLLTVVTVVVTNKLRQKKTFVKNILTNNFFVAGPFLKK